MTSHRRSLWVIAVLIAVATSVILVKLLLDQGDDGAGTLHDPIDPSQQTALKFGTRSHWLQPWRAYLDTVPAHRLRDAVGINFDVGVAVAPAAARLLAHSGFKRARVEIGWGSLSYDRPRVITGMSQVQAKLEALKTNGIRPLILLNGNHGAPCPMRTFSAKVTAPAAAGQRSVVLDRDSARSVVPGRTGLNSLTPGKAAGILFTAVDRSGTATLSKPLPRALSPGAYRASTLRYEPFSSPLLAGGSPNPTFELTMAGWLDYAGVVTRAVRQIMGDDDFDIEIWNEVSFGSDFLDRRSYYDPLVASGGGSALQEILKRTVSWLRDPANGVSGVGIADGFSNQTPFPAGSASPPGLTALGKHPYPPLRSFPRGAILDPVRPLDARGRPEGSRDRQGRWHDAFVPRYTAFFPEYALSAIQTETMVRDLSPIETMIGATAHGRSTRPAGASAPTVWITELNVDPRVRNPRFSTRDVRHIQAKTVLRSLTADVNKGVSAIDFYTAKGPGFGLIDPAFFGVTGADSGNPEGGEAMAAVRRLVRAIDGSRPVPRPRRIELRAISDEHGHRQFDGDGTASHPPLYDRDVLGFFPYQVDTRRFVIPVYVMTRDLGHVYDRDAPSSDPRRLDLPQARFRLHIGGVNGIGAEISASDPLTGEAVPVQASGRTRGGVVVELPATDSPRLLRIEERA